MRIDAYNSINQLYKVNSTKKTSKSQTSSKSDQLEISQTARDYQVAKSAVKNTDDIRTDLVNDIKSRIENGTYEVSDSDFADKLIAKFMMM